MDHGSRRSPARFLAPLALIAVVVAFLAVVNGSGGSGSTDTGSPASSTAAKTTTTQKSPQKKTASTPASAKEDPGKTYTVQVGDTLGGIADKTGVPLQTIEDLNPSVDPHAMVAGQKIKLK